jgi:hypothetical protein
MWTIERLDKLTIKHGNHEAPNGKVQASIDELCAAERRDNGNHSPDPKKRSGT